MEIKPARAVFLDRDGVITVEKDFVIDIDDLEFMPGAIDALTRIPADYLKIIVSNQSGIGRGYFTVDQVEDFNKVLLDELKKKSVLIDKIYYCPHSPEDKCDCRKPGIELFERAKRQFGIDFSKSWMVGDKSSDIQSGKNIGALTIQVLTGYAGNEPGAASIKPDYFADDLYKAVEIIRNES